MAREGAAGAKAEESTGDILCIFGKVLAAHTLLIIFDKVSDFPCRSKTLFHHCGIIYQHIGDGLVLNLSLAAVSFCSFFNDALQNNGDLLMYLAAEAAYGSLQNGLARNDVESGT